MDSTNDDDDDPRATELETLEAIFPELRRLNPPGFTFEIELPVAPPAPVTVLFPAISPNAPADKDDNNSSDDRLADSLQVAHLPPLLCRITLPDGYPSTRPPLVDISTTPQWLSPDTVARLQGEAPRLWEDFGRDLVAYTYIDHVQRAADDVFGAITSEGTLEVDPQHKLAVLDYDIKAKRAAFERETFECGVCLDPKKGSKCHKMLDCHHIFCLQCLESFYNDAIREGNLSTVRCLAPSCAKDRAGASKPARKSKLSFISPSELLQIGLSEDTVRRYVNLKYKTELESDKNTVYCPRRWCNGAARSKKHRKPSGLEFSRASDGDDDSDQSDQGGVARDAKGKGKAKDKRKFNTADLLSVCEDCGLAFCSRCFQSWHGEFYHCAPRRDDGEVTEEDKASLEYLKLHTSPCPTCNAPAQKTHGCNHMICSRCDTHFCYLCSAWLDPGNPYQHYNQHPNGKVTSCYMRLWELEGGDGDDVGLGFAGGAGGQRGAGNAAAAGPAPVNGGQDGPHGGGGFDHPEIEIDAEVAVMAVLGQGGHNDDGQHAHDDDDDDDNGGDDVAQNHDQQRGVGVAREAPLILRLMDNNHNNNNNNNNNIIIINNNNQVRGGGAADQRRNVARPRGAGDAHAHRRPGRGAPAHARDRTVGPRRGRAAAAPAARGGARLAGRQDQRGQQQQQQQRAGRPGLAAVGANADGLDAHQQAWIRHFVQMALVDAEDEIEGGDSEDEHMIFAIG